MDAKPKRHWFRYSLRTLLVFVTIACAGFGWLGMKVRAKQREREAVKAIRELGGDVMYDHFLGGSRNPPGPAWLRTYLGDDFFARAIYVSFEREGSEQQSLVHLRRLPHLTNLDVSTHFTDSGLSDLQALPKLGFLSLNNTRVTDAGLVHVQHLKQLWSLRLDKTEITDAGLQHLQSLTLLRELFLRDTQVTDAGCRELQKLLPNLTIYRQP